MVAFGASASNELEILSVVEGLPNSAAVAIEAETGRVLYAYNADVSFIPASLPKVLGDMVTYDDLEAKDIFLEDRLTLTSDITRIVANEEREDHRFLSHYGPNVITVDDLLKFKILRSMNEATIMLARHSGKTEEAFVEAMQAKADEIGCVGTVLRNSTGYYHEEQRSTPMDMCWMARDLIQNYSKHYARYGSREERIGSVNVGSFNYFVKYFDKADGIKTGRLAASGCHNLGSSVVDGKRVISLVAGAETPEQAAKANIELSNLALSRHSAYVPGLEAPKKDIQIYGHFARD